MGAQGSMLIILLSHMIYLIVCLHLEFFFLAFKENFFLLFNYVVSSRVHLKLFQLSQCYSLFEFHLKTDFQK